METKNYSYKIADIYFTFENAPKRLEEKRIFSLFSTDGNDENPNDKKQCYEITYDDIPGLNGNIVFEESSTSVCKTPRGYLWHHNRFDKENYTCAFSENDEHEKEKIYIPQRYEKYLLVTTELFRFIDNISVFLKYDALICHCSYIIYNGKAIIFTAESEGGKTTQAKLWEKYSSAEIINDDRAVLRYKDGEWTVHSLPFCGSANICLNKSAPLAAIVSVNKSEENMTQSMSTFEKITMLMSQISVEKWKNDDLERSLELMENLVENVEIFNLFCTIDEKSVFAVKKHLGCE